uniref:Large ribosomal subunit protein uL18 n=1 Tax=Candidatus Kentrum sp. LFY TaxID=2126342 RepID=A0A450WUS7_9GAMM|nr:MAG: large subunit ribosomal protein L18 [Candidatus Kentron sp. LFY]VFJ97401.1 MAG: large subunit ribosomal protein L18 [Candidatus Kentron sp. LFY]VFK20826.1 MAG: large subunit ribosomal protein L18 [Candidatus Kentron sp. LFY]
MNKKSARMRRSRRTRAKLRELNIHRLCVHRTPRNIYAQVIDPGGDCVVASVSTLDREIKRQTSNGGNIAAATVIGRKIAEMAKMVGVMRVGFDRSGFRYHGRIKALAEAVRENGISM